MTEPNSNEVPSTIKYQTSGAFKSSKDGKSKERKVLGDIEVFRDLIFIKANPSKTKDAAVKFNRTCEKFIDYARTTWPQRVTLAVLFNI
jgi:sarcosine oxidase delta subunit